MEPKVTFLPPPSPCPYLPDRMSQLHYELVPHMRPDDYMTALRDGWRRFGSVIFRPECPSCRMCQSLRVSVRSFRPSDSQRRAWKTNAGDVTIRVSRPESSPEKLELFERFHQHGHETKGWPAHGQPNLDVFVQNPFATEEWDYYVGDRLVGVGYVDALPEGLSAIYFYWAPAEASRSLGTFNILQMIEIANQP